MKWGFYFGAAFCLLMPVAGKAQSIGQVECPRSGGYVYLYSSMVTLDVRTTVPCGAQVQITGRYDGYFGVRTAKGDIGYMPLDSILLIKDKTGPQPAPPPDPRPVRERMQYDAPEAPAENTPAAPVGPDFILRNGTTVRLKLSKALSSATAHVNDPATLEVAEDVIVDGLLVIPKGAVATGKVTDAETKKKLGHGGKVGVVVNSVILGNNEKAAIRGYQEVNGANSVTGTVVPLVSGKDVVMPEGTEITASVDGDVHLKREAFPSAKDSKDASGAASSAAASAAQNPAQPHK